MTREQTTQWHRWRAWFPVYLSSGWVWGQTVERRNVCSEAAAWACDPIWEYRDAAR
jgi:hypothetical protein